MQERAGRSGGDSGRMQAHLRLGWCLLSVFLVLGALLYWIITGPLGEPGGAVLALACWVSAAALILLLETGVI